MSLENVTETIRILAVGETLSFNIADGEHWYGHGFNHVQPYPLETGRIDNPAFAVNNIQSPVWMSSRGTVVLADTVERLTVRLNAEGDRRLAITALDSPVTVRIFKGLTLIEAHRAFLKHVGWPPPSPSREQLGESLFCTWTEYPRCITQERVLAFARDIRSHGYPCHTLIIDDRWESCFGELAFSKDFPDPTAMVRQLSELGFAVWLWVTPFVNQESANFAELAKRRVLVQRIDGQGPALLRWWGGTAGLVDVTAPHGADWLREQLHYLKDTIGVAGFKIDGGDFKYQPAPEISAWHKRPGPSGYSDALLALFEEVAPMNCETRTAWLSQRRKILWREGGKDSHWGLDNGLAAMITLAQHLSLMGYDLQIPDMIPGRVQTMVSDMPLPSDELMVRWTEATALMPMMQFSYAPWHYATATEAAVRGFALLHECLSSYLHSHSVNRTIPLLRPLWYADPEDAALYTVPDAFLLGPDLLVAPIVNEGANRRDIRLPRGDWRDAWTSQTYFGGKLLKDHPAPCPGIPLFVRVENKGLFDLISKALSAIVRDSVPSKITSSTYMSGLDRDLSVTG
jgi:alpha-glucosidase (family GH31 glycosyl hydrolase)